MSNSASCMIVNQTGSKIMITSMGNINEYTTLTAPSVGTIFQKGEELTIKMTFIPPVAEIGFNMNFVCQEIFSMGSIQFKKFSLDPSIEPQQFTFGNEKAFKYSVKIINDSVAYITIETV